MTLHSVSRQSILAFLLMLVVTTAFAQSPGRRIALVVGNGAYQANSLKNPPNDAADVAVALKESGFEVTCVIDASLDAFESAVKAFAAALTGADTGLFYYAGHGVAVDGSNFLIPVSPRIDDLASVKSRAVAVDMIVDKMEATGVRTILVFLDSCRDNPFPGASRSGTRGLSVVAAPKTVNSLIAYATSPGDVALDGSGRNGIFSGALIKQLKEPGLELNVIMRNVKSEVASVSNNKQQPRVDDGMKESFYFVTMEAVSARARAERDRAAAELAFVKAQNAAREVSIANARNASEKNALEIEQRKERAIEDAKRIELENAIAVDVRLEVEIARRKADEEARNALSAADFAQAALLKAEAERRRRDYDALTRSDDSIGEYLKQISAMRKALEEIGARYSEAGAAMEAGMQKISLARKNSLSDVRAFGWESAAEFRARSQREAAAKEAAWNEEQRTTRAALQTEQTANEKDLRAKLATTEASLLATTYTVKGRQVAVSYGDFDKERKSWTLVVESTNAAFPYSSTLTHDISRERDIPTTFTVMETALKAKALACEIDYSVVRGSAPAGYALKTGELRVRNLITDLVVFSARNLPAPGMYRFTDSSLEFYGLLNLLAQPCIVNVQSDTGYASSIELSGFVKRLELPAGEYRLRFAKEGYRDREMTVSLKYGRIESVSATLDKMWAGKIVLPEFPVDVFIRANGQNADADALPAGIELDLAFFSPQAIFLSVAGQKIRFSEGESRAIIIPSGRIVLPYVPEGSTLTLGNRDIPLHPASVGVGNYESPEIPAGDYMVKLNGSIPYLGKVSVPDGGKAEPIGYREALLGKYSASRTGFQKNLADIRPRKVNGWISLATGIVGSLGSAASYYLGQQAITTYRTAVNPATIAQARALADLFATILNASAITTGLGFVLTPVFWLGNNEKALKDSIQSLDEKIQRLQKQ